MISFADMTAMAQGDVGFVGGGTFEDNMPRMSFTEAADAFNVWLSETNCEMYQQEQERDDALFEAACYAMNNGGDTAMLESAMMLNEASGSIMDKIKETWKKIKDWFSNLFQKLKMFISSFSKDNIGFWNKFKGDVEKSTKKVNRKGYDLRKFKIQTEGQTGNGPSAAIFEEIGKMISELTVSGASLSTLAGNEETAKEFLEKAKDITSDSLNKVIFGTDDKDELDTIKLTLGEKTDLVLSSKDSSVIGNILVNASKMDTALRSYQNGIKNAQDNLRVIEGSIDKDTRKDMKSDCLAAIQKYTKLYNQIAGIMNKQTNNYIKAVKIAVAEAKAWARAIVTGKHDEDAKSDDVDNIKALPLGVHKLPSGENSNNEEYSPLGSDFEFDW